MSSSVTNPAAEVHIGVCLSVPLLTLRPAPVTGSTVLWYHLLSKQPMPNHADRSMEDIPDWCVSNFDIDDEDASFVIKCNGKLFHIDVLANDLGDWSGKQEFLRLVRDASDDYDAEESL